MIRKFINQYSLILKVILSISLGLPALIIGYEVIISGKDSIRLFVDTSNTVVLFILIYYFLLLIISLVWITEQINHLLKIRKENRVSELIHLQSQVNPHFFFNTLNGLYGLIEKDPKKSKEMVLKLSELMSYSIYQGQKKEIALSEEIDYLRNYIELNRMRFHFELPIKLREEVIDPNIKILPLLFIMLVENALKHGLGSLGSKAEIQIFIGSNHKETIFEIENKFEPDGTEVREGIGLKNLKRRLQLAYPKRHNFSTWQKDGVFKAKLQFTHD